MSLLLADRIAEVIGRGYDGDLAEDEFTDLALAIHAEQRSRCRVLGRITAPDVRSWREIPLAPVSLFASHEIASFDVSTAARCFRSSGTTSGERSRHWFDRLDLYRAASLAGARWALRSDRWAVVSLCGANPESSLACMADWMADEFIGGAATLMIGPAFAYVAAIDAGRAQPLPAGSVLVETGGYKGRSREIPRAEFYAMLAESYRVPTERIISEYGMCEISSPLWERLGDPRGFRPAPWVRVRTLDPETMEDAAEGVIAIVDLANIHSSIGILTSDLGRWDDGRLLLLGRAPASTPKGCSLAV